ncbi:MAG: ATP-binding cassette domain-containing protein, partial [Acholeplasmatales bacterium]|nr:ATP-binding cassette domain-containing protein [Acholeplasmatales bacterium]
KNAFKPIDVLTDVGLQDKAKSFPAKMSGGEQQRVSIARAVAKNPKLLLCDEPTGALDSKTGKSIIKLLKDIALKHQTNVIIVTHNQSLKDIADQVIYIKNGMVEKIENNENPLSVDEIEW